MSDVKSPILSGSETNLEHLRRFTSSVSDFNCPNRSGSETNSVHHSKFRVSSAFKSLILSGSETKLSQYLR